MRAKRSVWDSEVFGVDVGILNEWRSEWKLEEVREANKDDFEVVFVKVPKWIDAPEGSVATDHVYDMEATIRVSTSSGVSVIEGAPPSGLLSVADTGFRDSRFLRDPILDPKAGVFYRRWLMDARGRVLVLEDHVGDAFLVEGRDHDEAGRIELIAVDPSRRGRGIGTRLIYGAVSRVGAPQVWRVRVSCRNWKAVRFYERLGFMARSVSTAFHIWGEA